jgi:acyl-CoA reductase-like NAD-dependent aldehyde dehydrogenase
MQEEIFGPLLPIITVESIEAAIEFINDRPHPLAIYIHTSDNSVRDEILDKTKSGGACINDCMMHYAKYVKKSCYRLHKTQCLFNVQ